MKYTIKFNKWLDDDNNPRVITFINNGRVTTNSLTSTRVTQNEDMFIKTMEAYLKDKNNVLIKK